MRSFTCPSCMEPVDAALLSSYETNWDTTAPPLPPPHTVLTYSGIPPMWPPPASPWPTDSTSNMGEGHSLWEQLRAVWWCWRVLWMANTERGPLPSGLACWTGKHRLGEDCGYWWPRLSLTVIYHPLSTANIFNALKLSRNTDICKDLLQGGDSLAFLSLTLCSSRKLCSTSSLKGSLD
jgi:hypothetical protein